MLPLFETKFSQVSFIVLYIDIPKRVQKPKVYSGNRNPPNPILLIRESQQIRSDYDFTFTHFAKILTEFYIFQYMYSLLIHLSIYLFKSFNHTKKDYMFEKDSARVETSGH